MEKKIFKKNMILIISSILVIYIFSYINRYYVDENSRFLRVPKNLKIINLGSSHGLYAFKYPKDIAGYNLASTSQSFYYDWKILKNNIKNIKKNGIVVIPISIFSFYQGEKDNIEYVRYYKFLSKEDILVSDERTDFLIKNFSLLYNGNEIKNILKKFYIFIKDKKIEKTGVQYLGKSLSFDEKVKEAEITTKRHLTVNNKEQRFNESFYNIKEILELCKENQFIPILITTPQSYLYNERITKEKYKERIYENIEKLKKEYSFKYFDYSHDERFERNLDLFYDDDHLTEKGAEKFTHILLKELKEKEIYNDKY